jgi:hypothetical protein
LKFERRTLDALGDFEHHLRTVAAEKDEPSGQIRAQAQSRAFRDAIFNRRPVKSRMKDHP